MSETIVICHVHEWHDVYGGRGKKDAHLLNTTPGHRGWLGNPFRLEDHDRAEAIAKYAKAFLGRVQVAEFAERVEQLRGQRVACWCRRSDEHEPRCHLDVVRAYLAGGQEAVANIARRGREVPT